MGASGTPLMYAFREREKILDLFESLTGARMMCNYMRFGGCRVDYARRLAGPGTDRSSHEFPRFLDEYENLLVSNEILMARTQGIGVLSKELAVNAGITGPMLRACGVNYDIRKVDNYGIYDRFSLPRAAGRPRRRLRPLHDPLARDARVAEDPRTGHARHSRRPHHRPQDQDSRLPPQARRSLRPHRSAQGRTWAFTSSATARRIRTATGFARPASSISPCWKTCASATTSRTSWSSSAASTSSWARWIDDESRTRRSQQWLVKASSKAWRRRRETSSAATSAKSA